jgi:hypothetical protein
MHSIFGSEQFDSALRLLVLFFRRGDEWTGDGQKDLCPSAITEHFLGENFVDKNFAFLVFCRTTHDTNLSRSKRGAQKTCLRKDSSFSGQPKTWFFSADKTQFPIKRIFIVRTSIYPF